jgi:hypothetical protein
MQKKKIREKRSKVEPETFENKTLPEVGSKVKSARVDYSYHVQLLGYLK